jgi:hypothetical protein
MPGDPCEEEELHNIAGKKLKLIFTDQFLKYEKQINKAIPRLLK